MKRLAYERSFEVKRGAGKTYRRLTGRDLREEVHRFEEIEGDPREHGLLYGCSEKDDPRILAYHDIVLLAFGPDREEGHEADKEGKRYIVIECARSLRIQHDHSRSAEKRAGRRRLRESKTASWRDLLKEKL